MTLPKRSSLWKKPKIKFTLVVKLTMVQQCERDCNKSPRDQQGRRSETSGTSNICSNYFVLNLKNLIKFYFLDTKSQQSAAIIYIVG